MENNNSQKKDLYKNVQELRIIRRQTAKSFVNFRQLYFERYHKMPDASFHIQIASKLEEISSKRGEHLAIASPRESAKSTLVTLEYILWSVCYALEKFILIISSNNDQAAEFLSHVKKELESNPLLIQDFPEVCETGRKPTPPRWKKDEIITRNGIQVLALGNSQQVRGRRNRECRPSLIILDDIEDSENTSSAEGCQKLVDWVTKSVLKAGSSNTNVICVGTIHHYNSFLAQLVSPSAYPLWNKRVFRSVIEWSKNVKDWETWGQIFNNREEYEGQMGPEAARKYFEARQAAMLEGTQVLWEAKRNYYSLMVMRENEGEYSFNSEMQNEPVNLRDCIFNVGEFHFWSDRFKTEEELLASLGEDVIVIGACDPSLGKSNFTGDYSAIVTAVKHMPTGIIYLLDADIERRRPDMIIEHILAHHKRRKFTQFAFESNQFQEYVAETLEKRGREMGLYLNVEQVKNQKDKVTRIQSLQPMFKNGTIQFTRKHVTLLEQLKFFPKGRHDDGPDALEMAVHLALENSNIVGITFFHVNPFTGEVRSETI